MQTTGSARNLRIDWLVSTAVAALAAACARGPSAPAATPEATMMHVAPTSSLPTASATTTLAARPDAPAPAPMIDAGAPVVPYASAAPDASVAAAPSSEEPVQDPPQVVAVVAAHPQPTRPDPRRGRFTLAQATAGLPPGADLVADIETAMGTFTCTLMQAEAPITVANFVGLARGVRDFWDPVAGRWTRGPFYDGSVFHRVIPDFMVQGGDILRSGRGGPGYSIPDENVASHDAAGLLCMANSGPNTGGAQFFITERPLPRLNGSYSVFGRCAPIDLVRRMARVRRSPRDQPIAPVYIQHVTVHR